MKRKTKDQLGRTLTPPNWPFRIVSLIPSETELLVDLGLENYIVGITKFCVHPSHIKTTKTVVGGTKKVSFDKIAALQPNIILCNKEENTKEIVTTLEKQFTVHVSDVKNISDTLLLISQFGLMFNRSNRAAELITEIKREANSFKNYIENSISKKVLYFIWKSPWMLAGKSTFIDYLMSLNNFVNCSEGNIRYPEISEKELNETKVDLILLSSEPYPFKKEHISEIEKTGISGKILFVDGEYFSWYGSRLLGAFKYFKSLHVNSLN